MARSIIILSALFIPLINSTYGDVSMSALADGLHALDAIERMDANQDGTLTALEVPNGAHQFVRQVAEAAGFSPKESLPLVDLKQKIRQEVAALTQHANKDGADIRSIFETARSRLREHYDLNLDGVLDVFEVEFMKDGEAEFLKRLSRQDIVQSIPVLKGMDNDGDGSIGPDELDPAMQGYLKRLMNMLFLERREVVNIDELEARVRLVAGAEFNKRAGNQESPARESEYQEQSRHRMYARSLIAQYDRNDNGELEFTEVKDLPPFWRRNDRNRDGRISVVEMADGFRRVESNSKQAIKRSPPKMRLRILPDGLPDWFLEKDSQGNRDGQVQMVEFSTIWDDETEAQFREIDVNNDGVVVPKEVLKSRRD